MDLTISGKYVYQLTLDQEGKRPEYFEGKLTDKFEVTFKVVL